MHVEKMARRGSMPWMSGMASSIGRCETMIEWWCSSAPTPVISAMSKFPVNRIFASVDVSFISLRLILPALAQLGTREVVTLIKPQFEAGRENVGKKA